MREIKVPPRFLAPKGEMFRQIAILPGKYDPALKPGNRLRAKIASSKPDRNGESFPPMSVELVIISSFTWNGLKELPADDIKDAGFDDVEEVSAHLDNFPDFPGAKMAVGSSDFPITVIRFSCVPNTLICVENNKESS